MLNTAMATYKAIKIDEAHDTLRNDDNFRSVIIFSLGQVPFLSYLAVLSKKMNRMKSPSWQSQPQVHPRERRRKCLGWRWQGTWFTYGTSREWWLPRGGEGRYGTILFNYLLATLALEMSLVVTQLRCSYVSCFWSLAKWLVFPRWEIFNFAFLLH